MVSSVVKEWREIYIYAIGLPLLFSIALTYRYFCESPRYYASKKKYYEAREVFRYISERNKRPPYEFHLFEEMEEYNAAATQYIRPNQNNTSNYISDNQSYSYVQSPLSEPSNDVNKSITR